MLQCLRLLDQVNLVLEDDDVLELHDLNGGEMFRGLRLGACLVARNKKKRSVHDRRAVQHRSHENVVAGTVHE
jgi:hypothetical protein